MSPSSIQRNAPPDCLGARLAHTVTGLAHCTAAIWVFGVAVSDSVADSALDAFVVSTGLFIAFATV